MFDNLDCVSPRRIQNLKLISQKPSNIGFDKKIKNITFIKSHAVGKAVAQPYGFEIDFARNLFSELPAWFFVTIFKFIFTPIFEIEGHEKNSLTPKKKFIFEGRFSCGYFLYLVFPLTKKEESDSFFRSLIKWRCAYWSKTSMATQRPYRQRRQYLTPTAWVVNVFKLRVFRNLAKINYISLETLFKKPFLSPCTSAFLKAPMMIFSESSDVVRPNPIFPGWKALISNSTI